MPEEITDKLDKDYRPTTEMSRAELESECWHLRSRCAALFEANKRCRAKNKELRERCAHTKDWVDEK